MRVKYVIADEALVIEQCSPESLRKDLIKEVRKSMNRKIAVRKVMNEYSFSELVDMELVAPLKYIKPDININITDITNNLKEK